MASANDNLESHYIEKQLVRREIPIFEFTMVQVYNLSLFGILQMSRARAYCDVPGAILFYIALSFTAICGIGVVLLGRSWWARVHHFAGRRGPPSTIGIQWDTRGPFIEWDFLHGTRTNTIASTAQGMPHFILSYHSSQISCSRKPMEFHIQ